MWSNNTGDAKIEGDQIEVLKILNGHENIDPNIYFKINTGKITGGHDFTLVKAVFCPGFQKGRVPSEKGTLAR